MADELPMQERILDVATAVVAQADREHPADRVLRAELKRRRGLSPLSSRAICQAVFAYYRWLGWLDPKAPVAERMLEANALSDRFAQDPRRFDTTDLGARAVPGWLAGQMDLTPQWLLALQAQPKLWLRARPGQGRSLAQKLGEGGLVREGPLVDALEYVGAEDLFCRAEFHAGEFEVQDLSSQWVGRLCDPQPGQTWWDTCAGEGGKTLHLSDLMQNRGLIWSSDRAEWRLRILKRRAARAQVFNYRVLAWDGAAHLPTQTRFDGVLVDAPCSGIGAWQRNPHARWTTTWADVQELASIQLQLLAHAAPAVKLGGKLVYAVCTLIGAETRQVVNAFERQFAQFTPLPVANPLRIQATPAAQHWCWPQEHGGNGMFVAVWRKNGG